MTPELFNEALGKLEIEWIRKGLTLNQIQACEEDALNICRADDDAKPTEYASDYLRMVSRLVNSGLVN